MSNKRALVCGAGGFIGSHLVKRLKQEGYWVRGVDLKRPEFGATAADDFVIADLREPRGGGEDLMSTSKKHTNWRPTWEGPVTSSLAT